MTLAAADAVDALWRDTALDPAALDRLRLTGAEPVLPSSFAVATAAQASLGAAALASAEIGRLRNGLVQTVAVDARDAALESCAAFTLDGVAPPLWDPLAGLYACADGWVRLHTNFVHHRDGVLRLLGLPVGALTSRAEVAAALAHRSATAFESEATEAGLVVAALRSFEEWDRHPQAASVATLPLVEIAPIGAAPPLTWPSLAAQARPLAGLRVLDLTRILAGPVAGRTLAAHGADVLLVNAPQLPNIAAIADTSRGKRSALADLRRADAAHALASAVAGADVFVQGYRPGGLAALGFGPADVARLRPGIVYASLSAYGRVGPWASRRGFDSLVQAATGFNVAEGEAAGSPLPKTLPMPILDMATGFLLAFGIAAALVRQRREGGSWHVQLSLARTGLWLRHLGRAEGGLSAPPANFSSRMEASDSGFGRLLALRHAAVFSATPAGYARPAMPPGTHPLAWSA